MSDIRVPPEVPTGTSIKQGWTVETALQHVLAVIESNDIRYSQRFEAAQSGVTTAFKAAETAMQAAFAAQKEAVNAAFAAQKDAITSALASADRAVTKAEIASEKRFDSVNEFRNTLADQQRTLMPRAEAEVRMSALTEKVDSALGAVKEGRASSNGFSSGWGVAVGAVALILTMLMIVSVVVGFIKH